MRYGTRVKETLTNANYIGKVIAVADDKAKVLLDTSAYQVSDKLEGPAKRASELYFARWFFMEELEIIEEES